MRSKTLFGKKKQEKIDKLGEISYEKKSEFMSTVLGPEHDMVMHAIIPYDVGGTLDLYYFTNFFNGTAIASKELTNYELIMCTNKKIDLETIKDDIPQKGSFAYDHQNINRILMKHLNSQRIWIQ